MAQISARLPDELVKRLDIAAGKLNRSRADVIRQAIEYYVDDVEDLRFGLERLQDPSDPVLDWSEVRDEILAAEGSAAGTAATR